MNVLPFVFSFLLLLTLMSSFMFSSTLRTSREKTILLSSHQTYLSLISKQQKTLYLQKRPKEKDGSPLPVRELRSFKQPIPSNANFRDLQKCAKGSKLHLFAMIHGPNLELRHCMEIITCRLLEELYSTYSFYKKTDIAETLVKEMIDQKIKTLESLILKDPELDAIYYKMLRGTNSTYPPLSDYCQIGTIEDPPIRFRFASTPVIKAALGKELANKLFSLEKEAQETSPLKKGLIKKDFQELLKTDTTSNIPSNLEPLLFNYRNEKKGVSQILKDKQTHIRAVHAVEL